MICLSSGCLTLSYLIPGGYTIVIGIIIIDAVILVQTHTHTRIAAMDLTFKTAQTIALCWLLFFATGGIITVISQLISETICIRSSVVVVAIGLVVRRIQDPELPIFPSKSSEDGQLLITGLIGVIGTLGLRSSLALFGIGLFTAVLERYDGYNAPLPPWMVRVVGWITCAADCICALARGIMILGYGCIRLFRWFMKRKSVIFMLERLEDLRFELGLRLYSK